MILHLEAVAGHAANRLHAGQRFVGQRADLVEGLQRIDDGGEAVGDQPAIDMQHLDRPAGDAAQRMQHDEAGPVGREVAMRRGDSGEIQAAVGQSRDRREIADAAMLVAAARPVGNPEAVGALAHHELVDNRRIGAPVLVAHQEGDGAQHLDLAETDIAQCAIVELDR